MLDTGQVENLSIRGRDPISLLKILPGVTLQNNDQELFAALLAGIAEDVTVLHRLALQLANSREWPNYRQASEFRPVRDKSMANRR